MSGHLDDRLLKQRNAIMSATGRSKLVAQHRLLESVSYFLRADKSWAEEALIEPLRADTTDALILWQSAARQTLFDNTLKFIGKDVLIRALDDRLPRRTRESLIFSLIVESMHAFRTKRKPKVGHVNVRQLLMKVEGELRARAARTIKAFVRDLGKATDPADVFRNAAQPFLAQVWPQERSLSNPGVARALADLPANCGEVFKDAVDSIESFLMPFDCWSLSEYDLYGDSLSKIDSAEKADAFLKLLDLTVGQELSSIVPHDVADALERIAMCAPTLSKDRRYKRLEAASRE